MEPPISHHLPTHALTRPTGHAAPRSRPRATLPRPPERMVLTRRSGDPVTAAPHPDLRPAGDAARRGRRGPRPSRTAGPAPPAGPRSAPRRPDARRTGWAHRRPRRAPRHLLGRLLGPGGIGREVPGRVRAAPVGRLRVAGEHRAGRGDPRRRELAAGVRAGRGMDARALPRDGAGTERLGCRSPIGGTRGGSDLALRAVILTHRALNCQRLLRSSAGSVVTSGRRTGERVASRQATEWTHAQGGLGE